MSHAENFADFESVKGETEEEIKDMNKEFEKIKTELNGLKLNFEEELMNYLGIDKEHFKLNIDDDGYIVEIERSELSPVKLKNKNPDLSWFCRLRYFDVRLTDVVNPILPKEHLEKVDF